MKFCVTNKHIKKGLRYNESLCPVALSIQEKTKGEVFVSYAYICINGEKYKTNNDILYFLLDFDHGLEVEPFEFELNYSL